MLHGSKELLHALCDGCWGTCWDQKDVFDQFHLKACLDSAMEKGVSRIEWHARWKMRFPRWNMRNVALWKVFLPFIPTPLQYVGPAAQHFCWTHICKGRATKL